MTSNLSMSRPDPIQRLTSRLRDHYDAAIGHDQVGNVIADCPDASSQEFIYHCLSFPDCIDTGSSFMLNNIDQFVYPSIPADIIALIQECRNRE